VAFFSSVSPPPPPRLFGSIFFNRVFGRFVTRGVQKRDKKKSREILLSFQKKHSLTYVTFFFFAAPLAPTTPSTETAVLELKSTAFDACHIGPARGALGPGDPALGVLARCTSTQYHCLVRAA
jgi:hypothetical protein